MSGSLTAQSLLRGAVYSLEQCGLLLGDAKLLYKNGSYASALAVAAFAREDLGRSRMLLKLRKGVLAGETLAVEDVKTACDDHVRKQEAGMTSLTLRAESPYAARALSRSRLCRSAAIASRSLRRCPTMPTPKSFRSSAVKFGRTVSSISPILANATRVCDAKIWQPVDPRVFVLPTADRHGRRAQSELTLDSRRPPSVK